MPVIKLTTFINAPLERVFNLSRSIDLHTISTIHSNEKAVAGVPTGLININETVTWQAFHLFKIRRFTSKITAITLYEHFCDEMIEGDFITFKHNHYFNTEAGISIMKDIIEFKSPYFFVGNLFNKIYLTNYLKKITIQRNDCIKQYAETDKWKKILNKNN